MADGEIVEFFPVVGLKREYGSPELCGDISIECNESGGNIGFPTKRKCPHKVRVITQYNKIIKITRITRYWRCPYIAVNQLKWKGRNCGRGTKRKANMLPNR